MTNHNCVVLRLSRLQSLKITALHRLEVLQLHATATAVSWNDCELRIHHALYRSQGLTYLPANKWDIHAQYSPHIVISPNIFILSHIVILSHILISPYIVILSHILISPYIMILSHIVTS